MLSSAKKIIAILFLSILLLPVFMIAVNYVEKLVVIKEMAERLEKEQLQSVTIAASEIQWIKQGKEAIIDSKMFDVKYYSKNADGTLTLTGLYDEKEKAIEAQAKKILQRKTDKATGGASMFIFVAFVDTSDFSYYIKPFSYCRTFSIPKSIFYISYHTDNPSPPPDIV